MYVLWQPLSCAEQQIELLIPRAALQLQLWNSWQVHLLSQQYSEGGFLQSEAVQLILKNTTLCSCWVGTAHFIITECGSNSVYRD